MYVPRIPRSRKNIYPRSIYQESKERIDINYRSILVSGLVCTLMVIFLLLLLS